MYEFWYDYVKSKNGEKAKLCYMDRDSLIVYIKTKTLEKMLKLQPFTEYLRQTLVFM